MSVDTGSAYFARIDANRFEALPLVGGAWSAVEQHVAPSLGLVAHLMENHHACARRQPLQLGRLSFDILGTMPIAEVAIECRVVRPGRTIELVEAVLACRGRTIISARGWFMQRLDTRVIAGSALPAIPSRYEMPSWPYASIWSGAFVRSVEARRIERERGRAAGWIRTRHALIAGDTASATARAVGLLDLANGLAPRASPEQVAFPNLDLNVSFFRTPVGEWLGYDTTASFGPDGLGLTHSIIHDTEGPLGAVTQCLTVRPA